MVRVQSYSDITMLAVEMVTRYEDGFLPGPGGWLDQDHFYVTLIQEGLSEKRKRERINAQAKARQTGTGRR